MPQTNELAVFQGKQIRRVWHNNQWHFVILDIIRVLTDSPNPSDYLKKIRKRDESLNEGWGQIVIPLRLRVQEIENPEIAMQRMREIYKSKGYSDEWIEKRTRGIAIRDELTKEWDQRGAKTQKEYAILTSEISKATFGLTPSQYQKFKGLTTQNLRDHMDDIELILTMLGEATTTRFTRIRLYSIKFLLIKLSKSLNNSNLSVKLFKNKTRWYSPI